MTFATGEDFKMVKNLERTLRDRLVYKNSTAANAVADAQPEFSVERQTGNQQSSEKPATTQQRTRKSSGKIDKPRKMRGKRSSQRNRGAAFDFGL